MRSLIELPGLKVSILARTVAFTTPFVMRLIRTIGVSPMASRMLSKTFFGLWSCSYRSCRERRSSEAATQQPDAALEHEAVAAAAVPAGRDKLEDAVADAAHEILDHFLGHVRIVACPCGGPAGTRKIASDDSRHTCFGLPAASCAVAIGSGDSLLQLRRRRCRQRLLKPELSPIWRARFPPGVRPIPATPVTTTAMPRGLSSPHSGRRSNVRPALDDTLQWLSAPARWETNGGGKGGADDKRLARIQFAHATTAAFEAALVPKTAVEAAAAIVAADQQPDGSWRLDSSDSIGSPATYGTALATVFARRTLIASGLPALADRIAQAERWLARVEAHNVPDATAILFGSADRLDAPEPDNWRAAIELLKKGQGRDGGWGPVRDVARRAIRYGPRHPRPSNADPPAVTGRTLRSPPRRSPTRSRRAGPISSGNNCRTGAGTRRRDQPGKRVTRSEFRRPGGRSWQ